MDSRTPALLLCALFSACHCSAPATPEAPVADTAVSRSSDAGAGEKLGPRSHGSGPIETLPQCPDGDGEFLQRAQFFYDSGRYADALACAVQASGAEPLSPDAHSERAWALVGLGKLEDARTAYARALALDPDHRDSLQGSAELYITKLPFSREFAELGLAYAMHGHELAGKAGDPELAGRFASIASTALNDLGRAREALALASQALAVGVDADNARYEKASALWELCKFDEAKTEFEALLLVEGRAAHAHHYLGLIAERRKDLVTASRELTKARQLDPVAFPPPVAIGSEEFARVVALKVAGLPQSMRSDLQSIPVTAQDIPDLEDLIGNDPPLSPTIVGLFRGPSLGEECYAGENPCRSIVLYRKNIARTVLDRAELERQVEVTLLHEVGHLRGEDDTQLVARGLE
jgi:tetratricopeptide (TPR) repeat protein